MGTRPGLYASLRRTDRGRLQRRDSCFGADDAGDRDRNSSQREDFKGAFHLVIWSGRHGAEDGIRTRDPHLGKVRVFVRLGLVGPPTCGSVHRVSSPSSESAPVVERSTIDLSCLGPFGLWKALDPECQRMTTARRRSHLGLDGESDPHGDGRLKAVRCAGDTRSDRCERCAIPSQKSSLVGMGEAKVWVVSG